VPRGEAPGGRCSLVAWKLNVRWPTGVSQSTAVEQYSPTLLSPTCRKPLLAVCVAVQTTCLSYVCSHLLLYQLDNGRRLQKLQSSRRSLSLSFTSHSTRNRSFRRRSLQPISWLSAGETKPNTTGQTTQEQNSLS